MKLFAAPKYLSDAVAPLVALNYLVGLRIFEYPRGKLRSVPSLIYLLFLLGIFFMSLHVGFNLFKGLQLQKINYVSYQFLIYVCASTITIEMILGYIYTKTVNACYRKLDQIDETLRQLGSMINCGKIYFWSITIVIAWFSYVLSIIISSLRMDIDLLTVFCITVVQIYIININFIFISEFSTFVKYLQARFKLINELLYKYSAVSTTEGMKLNLFTMENYTKITIFLRQIHLELCRILKMLSASFGIQIILEIGIAIITITLLLYNLYIYTFILVEQQQKAASYDQIYQTFRMIILATINIFKIVYINRICKQTTNEGKKTSEIIHEIYGCYPDTDIREEILWSPVEFFTFGISLNYHILSSCLNTVTTYLVIMIQMYNSLESSKNS
ncbi:PREDICTED: uncharacterized protein LOC106751580 [Dinoponera quadriceps]|uniref:Gustatory receptor n=1 Tax=Dinoponera quadriceps TaxID=609295 RepID=A0A6P3YC40_DINQU|nr:PREDICTED: uncharacterized protein LOC106751580 [Dinoponera quadriceps]